MDPAGTLVQLKNASVKNACMGIENFLSNQYHIIIIVSKAQISSAPQTDLSDEQYFSDKCYSIFTFKNVIWLRCYYSGKLQRKCHVIFHFSDEAVMCMLSVFSSLKNWALFLLTTTWRCAPLKSPQVTWFIRLLSPLCSFFLI